MTLDIREYYHVEPPPDATVEDLRTMVSTLNQHLLDISRRLEDFAGKATQAQIVTGTSAQLINTPYALQGMMKDEDAMTSDSATHWASQQSIKAYIDAIQPYLFSNVHFPDYNSADQGETIANNGDGLINVRDIIDNQVGASEQATIIFRHNSGGNNTKYTFGTAETIENNFTVVMEPGAILEDDGNIQLRILGPFIAAPVETFDWSGLIKFGSNMSAATRGIVAYVEWWGGLANGTTNNDNPIQAAIDSFDDAIGGTVQFLSGKYYVDGAVDVKDGVILKGTGWSIKQEGELDKGTEIYTDNVNAVLFTMNNSTQLRDLAISQDHDAPGGGWAPTVYKACVDLEGSDGIIDNVLFFGVYIAIDNDSNVGRWRINNVSMQSFSLGLRLDTCLDVMYVTNFHDWPFWSTNANVTAWTKSNGTGIELQRVDNPFFSNIFVFWKKIGLYFTTNGGGFETIRAHFTNVGMDAYGLYGILVDSSCNGMGAVFANLYCVGTDSGYTAGQSGIWIDGDNCQVRIDNYDSVYARNNSIHVGGASGTGNRLYLDNYVILSFNQAAGGHTAISVAAGNEAYLGSQRYYDASGTATGGAGTILNDGEGLGNWQTEHSAATVGAGTVNYTGTMNNDGFICAWLEADVTTARATIALETPSGTSRVEDSLHWIEPSPKVTRAGACIPVKKGAGGSQYDIQVIVHAGTVSVKVYQIYVNQWPHPNN